MASLAGRKIVLTWDGSVVAGVKSRSITVGNSTIDVTNDDSNAWRTLLEDIGVSNVDISVSGILTDDTLLAASLSGDTTATASFAFDAGLTGSAQTLSGTFFMDSFAITGETEAGATFEATFKSSGAPTYA
jgi:predicted secreted protein